MFWNLVENTLIDSFVSVLTPVSYFQFIRKLVILLARPFTDYDRSRKEINIDRSRKEINIDNHYHSYKLTSRWNFNNVYNWLDKNDSMKKCVTWKIIN